MSQRTFCKGETSLTRLVQHVRYCFVLSLVVALSLVVPSLRADDYILTIGGGYRPSGNQASLEENVLFFRQLLVEKHRRARHHDVFFADGNDETPDLQVLARHQTRALNKPATELLASLHRRRGQGAVEYRNHQIPEISGPLSPALIKTRLQAIATTVRAGDRVIVYVTAHGSEGPQGDEYNTTIDCWNDKKITSREFSGWLDSLPTDVPAIMVMAQCYSGGFARTIFDDLNANRGLSSRLRVGFFAQQHNLPAAGCRPDIEQDQEFSSYFWGAMAGRSRTGKPLEDCDINGDGSISFAEAYAYAVWAGETVDIPLTATDVLLRTYSRMTIEPPRLEISSTQSGQAESSKPDPTLEESRNDIASSTMKGSLQSFVDRGRPMAARIVSRLSAILGFSLDDDVSLVIDGHEAIAKQSPDSNPFPRGRRGRSGRRELLKEISNKWPDLGEPRNWEDSALLDDEHQEQLFAEIKDLPSWKAYAERQHQNEESNGQSGKHELREVKFRRLIKTLELIELEQNLPRIASPEIVERYRQMVALENSSFDPVP